MARVRGGLGAKSLTGQWRGKSQGAPEGDVILDLEEVDGRLSGTAYLYPSDSRIPSSLMEISTNSSGNTISTHSRPSHFNPRDGSNVTDRQIAKLRGEEIYLPEQAQVSVHLLNDDAAEATWSSGIGTNGAVALRRSEVGERSTIRPAGTVNSWADFKSQLLNKQHREYIYRGQALPWPLQTSFHRTNQKDLRRYLTEDFPALYRAITGRISHVFDLGKPDEFGAFMNLVQHHGYPTPLLDWTYSPFVAAWFAFTARVDADRSNEPVRIFCLDKKYYEQSAQFSTLTRAPPHFSILETLTLANDRAIPQQGVLTLTNVNDIEEHISQLNKPDILTAYDLPRAEAKEALNDLALMGITRATLFPGLDSICSDLRARMFE